MNKRNVGKNHEAIAADYLLANGYVIVEKNFNCKMGEIDIIAKDNEYLCFVEVKYRSSATFGMPEEAVDYKKMKNISKVANYYLLKKGISDVPIRFDVVSILNDDIKLIKNAFDYCW